MLHTLRSYNILLSKSRSIIVSWLSLRYSTLDLVMIHFDPHFSIKRVRTPNLQKITLPHVLMRRDSRISIFPLYPGIFLLEHCKRNGSARHSAPHPLVLYTRRVACVSALLSLWLSMPRVTIRWTVQTAVGFSPNSYVLCSQSPLLDCLVSPS